MKVAVVGATGLVGTRMLEVLAERNFPVTELIPVASAKSVGRKITFQGKEWTVVSAEDAIAARPDLALFSAGGSINNLKQIYLQIQKKSCILLYSYGRSKILELYFW